MKYELPTAPLSAFVSIGFGKGFEYGVASTICARENENKPKAVTRTTNQYVTDGQTDTQPKNEKDKSVCNRPRYGIRVTTHTNMAP